MNENVNLCEILKDCPKGTKFYSPIFGDVEFETLSYRKTQEGIYEVKYIVVKDKRRSFWFFPPNGHCTIGGVVTQEIMLFPSKDCRDWSKWKCPKPLMMSVTGMLDDDLRAGRSHKCKQKSKEKKMFFHEREKHKLKLNIQREARLKTFVIHGETVLANSRKDALKRYNHRYLKD